MRGSSAPITSSSAPTARSSAGIVRVASRYVMSRRVASRRVASCRVVSCRVASCRDTSRRVTSRRVVSCHVAVTSCHVLVTLCHVTSHVLRVAYVASLSCRVVLSHVTSMRHVSILLMPGRKLAGCQGSPHERRQSRQADDLRQGGGVKAQPAQPAKTRRNMKTEGEWQSGAQAQKWRARLLCVPLPYTFYVQ